MVYLLFLPFFCRLLPLFYGCASPLIGCHTDRFPGPPFSLGPLVLAILLNDTLDYTSSYLLSALRQVSVMAISLVPTLRSPSHPPIRFNFPLLVSSSSKVRHGAPSLNQQSLCLGSIPNCLHPSIFLFPQSFHRNPRFPFKRRPLH